MEESHVRDDSLTHIRYVLISNTDLRSAAEACTAADIQYIIILYCSHTIRHYHWTLRRIPAVH